MIDFKGTEISESVRNQSDAVALQIVNRLSFLMDSLIAEPQYMGGSVTNVIDGKVILSLASIARSTSKASATCILHRPKAEAIYKSLLEQQTLPGETQCDLYRTLIGVQDVVARFMALYLILMSFHDDNQSKVDKFIIECKPDVIITRRPGKQAIPETVYSRLRNQIGHNRNKSLEETRQEMEQHVVGLQEIVKVCLKKNAP